MRMKWKFECADNIVSPLITKGRSCQENDYFVLVAISDWLRITGVDWIRRKEGSLHGVSILAMHSQETRPEEAWMQFYFYFPFSANTTFILVGKELVYIYTREWSILTMNIISSNAFLIIKFKIF